MTLVRFELTLDTNRPTYVFVNPAMVVGVTMVPTSLAVPDGDLCVQIDMSDGLTYRVRGTLADAVERLTEACPAGDVGFFRSAMQN